MRKEGCEPAPRGASLAGLVGKGDDLLHRRVEGGSARPAKSDAVEAKQRREDAAPQCHAFLSRHAYTVYLIHPVVVVASTHLWMLVLRASAGVVIHFDARGVPETTFTSDATVWFGCLFTIVVTLVVVWPLACLVRNLPGASRIL